MNDIRKHVFVCVNERNESNPKGCCASKDSLEIMTQLKRAIKEREVKDIRVSKSGCLGCCLLYTSPSPRDATLSRMPSSA